MADRIVLLKDTAQNTSFTLITPWHPPQTQTAAQTQTTHLPAQHGALILDSEGSHPVFRVRHAVSLGDEEDPVEAMFWDPENMDEDNW